MCRCFPIAASVLLRLSGCASPKMPMEMPKRPTPGPEMARVAVLLGDWEGTAEMVEPSPEEMKAFMPEGEEMPSSFAGGNKYEWVLGGMYLKGEGWHEMGDGQKMNFVEAWKWDAKAKKYKTWFFTDWGEHGSGWATWCDTDCLCMDATAQDVEGRESKGTGRICLVDDNTMEWVWSESGAKGKMKLEGTSKKKG